VEGPLDRLRDEVARQDEHLHVDAAVRRLIAEIVLDVENEPPEETARRIVERLSPVDLAQLVALLAAEAAARAVEGEVRRLVVGEVGGPALLVGRQPNGLALGARWDHTAGPHEPVLLFSPRPLSVRERKLPNQLLPKHGADLHPLTSGRGIIL
jgi:hypothetical protein